MKLTNATFVLIACGTYGDSGCVLSEEIDWTPDRYETFMDVEEEPDWRVEVERIEALGVIEVGALSDVPDAAWRLQDLADAAEEALAHPRAVTCSEVEGSRDLQRLDDLDIIAVLGVVGVAEDEAGLIIEDGEDCARVSALHDITAEAQHLQR